MTKVGNCVTHIMSWVLLGAMVLSTGCEPEMPVPPPRESTNPAEDDFYWAMERMEHAIERFQPPSSLGLRVKRQLSYELIPPKDRDTYQARVKIATLTVYQPPIPTPSKAKAKDEAPEENLEDPFVVPTGDPTGETAPVIPPVPKSQIKKREVADPPLPLQELKEEKEYLLAYVGDQWRLEAEELSDNERMWFDYALQQGEFSLDAAVDD